SARAGTAAGHRARHSTSPHQRRKRLPRPGPGSRRRYPRRASRWPTLSGLIAEGDLEVEVEALEERVVVAVEQPCGAPGDADLAQPLDRPVDRRVQRLREAQEGVEGGILDRRRAGCRVTRLLPGLQPGADIGRGGLKAARHAQDAAQDSTTGAEPLVADL